MIIENTEITKYKFSGHDSFQCRQLWLKKGYDYVLKGKDFNDEDAVVQLVVGSRTIPYNLFAHSTKPKQQKVFSLLSLIQTNVSH